MNKKILTAVIGVVIVAALGGLVYYFQGGNLQGFMGKIPNSKSFPAITSGAVTATPIPSYKKCPNHNSSRVMLYKSSDTFMADNREPKYYKFEDLFNEIKTELDENGGRTYCPYVFNLSGEIEIPNELSQNVRFDSILCKTSEVSAWEDQNLHLMCKASVSGGTAKAALSATIHPDIQYTSAELSIRYDSHNFVRLYPVRHFSVERSYSDDSF